MRCYVALGENGCGERRQEYNSFSWFRISPARGQLQMRFQARRVKRSLKEKDTNMNGPARNSAFAVVLAGMVLSMSGCDRLAPATS